MGLGESGEAYLVGPDYRLRTESRFLIEDPDQYMIAIREAGVDAAAVEAIESLDRTAQLLVREVRHARSAAAAAREELAELETRARELERSADASRRALGARARALYRAGELGSVRLLFASQDLPDFLARVSSLNRLLDIRSKQTDHVGALGFSNQVSNIPRHGARIF